LASKLAVPAALAAWLGIVLWLGGRGGFVSPPGTPPLPLLAAVVLPLAAFFLLSRLSRTVRAFVLSIDLRLATTLQAWRFGGFAFLALYAHGILPGVFAFPAGLGDMAIAAAAPWLALRLGRDPAFAATRAFRTWNVLGILDLVVAVSVGALSSMQATGSPGEVTIAPMAQLPLVLVPGYFVPLFLMLHICALHPTRARP
jgi:hypothetical protein